MKLKLGLIPAKAFWTNLRSELPINVWRTISSKVLDDNNRTCSICGAKQKTSGDMHCHEDWNFDLSNQTQTLNKLVCVCSRCHNVIHWGSSQLRKLNMFMLLEHALNVNQCSSDKMNREIIVAFADWNLTRDVNWVFDKVQISSKVYEQTGISI